MSKSPRSSFKVQPHQRDLPATQGMLGLVRTELKADIRSMKSGMEARFKEVDARFNQVDARFNQVDARFDQMEARFSQVDERFNQMESRFNHMESKFNQLEAQIARTMEAVHHVAAEVARNGVLMEEQNSRNRVVLEGLTSLYQRQDRVEKRVDDFESLVRNFIRGGR